jgi:hypothetical protein
MPIVEKYCRCRAWGGGDFIGRSQLLQGVRPHRVQEPVSGSIPPGGNHRDQRLIHQPGEDVERHAGGHGKGGVGIETADKHGQTPKRRLLDGIEKGVAPLDRGTNTAVMRRRTAPRPGQFTQVALQADNNLIWRHDADSGSRQLDAERKMINTGTDIEDGGF